MCGIYGVLELRQGRQPDERLLDRMGQMMIHRGPDDQGHHFGNGAAIGMRRLSIIDLAGGHQPIANEDGTVWVVCNGEIYNFKELRAGLEARGHVFSCDSDTEVIVHLGMRLAHVSSWRAIVSVKSRCTSAASLIG